MEERAPYDVPLNTDGAIWEEARNTETHANSSIDQLHWRDKVPLALALMAQSYVVFNWYLHSTHGIHQYVDFVIALAAGISLDWLTISTVMGRREGRTSIWSWLTSFGAFIASAMIAYDTYASLWWPLDGKALLHVCYPLVVLLYSLHLATPKHPRNWQAISPHQMQELPLLGDSPSREKIGANREPLLPEAKQASASFPCPFCDAALDSIGELGAANRWGHCRHCKGTKTVQLSYSAKSAQNGSQQE